jgi:hypothetical protein
VAKVDADTGQRVQRSQVDLLPDGDVRIAGHRAHASCEIADALHGEVREHLVKQHF